MAPQGRLKKSGAGLACSPMHGHRNELCSSFGSHPPSGWNQLASGIAAYAFLLYEPSHQERVSQLLRPVLHEASLRTLDGTARQA